jgi:ComF family protein
VQPRCIGCEKTLSSGAGPLCVHCHRILPWWRRVDGCPRCGSPSRSTVLATNHDQGSSFEGCGGCLVEGSALHACITLARYEGALRRWIPGFKNPSGPFGPAIAIRLAIDHLATMLARRVAMETRERPDLIVSVPLHPRRKRHRGFNHVDPIANRIARMLDIPCAPNALRRCQDTASQARLVGRARRENVRDAFRATARLDSARRVWLVDDVLTTGSTLDAASNALLEAGCVEVRALTLAATLPARRTGKRKAAQQP